MTAMCCRAERSDRLNRNKNTRHLTNYSLNKYSTQFSHHDDPTDGSKGTKRTISSLMQLLGQQGVDSTQLWADIKTVVGRTTEAMALACTGGLAGEEGMDFSELWGVSLQHFLHAKLCVLSLKNVVFRVLKRAAPKSIPGEQWAPEKIGESEWRDCFHVLGFDVMLEERRDDRGRRQLQVCTSLALCTRPALRMIILKLAALRALQPYLLEVNCNPSLGIDGVYTATTHARGYTTLDGATPSSATAAQQQMFQQQRGPPVDRLAGGRVSPLASVLQVDG